MMASIQRSRASTCAGGEVASRAVNGSRILKECTALSRRPRCVLAAQVPHTVRRRDHRVDASRHIGDLSEQGLRRPRAGPFTRLKRFGKAPAIVDKEVLAAIRAGRIEVVGALEALDPSGAVLTDGSHLEVSATIAATGFRCGLERLVGHLDVLDDGGAPRFRNGDEAVPGPWFVGYRPVPAVIHDVVRVARRITSQMVGKGRAERA